MISDLHLSLLGLGALLVAAVWAYNHWQERKYRREIGAAFNTASADPLMQDAAEQADVPAWARDQDFESNDPSIPTLDSPLSPPSVSAPLHIESEPEPLPVYTDMRREPVFAEPEAPAEPYIAAVPEPTFEPAIATPAVLEQQDEAPYEAYDDTRAPADTSADAAMTQAESPAVAAAPLEAAISPWPPAEWCDESIDALARIEFAVPIARDELIVAHRAMQDQVRLPLRAYVQLLTGSWQRLDDVLGGEFQTLCLALQLVDRHGPVTKAELDSLHHASQGLANLRQGQTLYPNFATAAEQAKALDEFCAQLDLQLALNVVDTGLGAFPGTKVRGLAEAAGMQLMANGEFQAFDEDGAFLFAMANMGESFSPDNFRTLQTHGLTFLLDVPHVSNGAYAFERMLATARQCTTALNGSLVNAQRVTVNDAMVDSIRKKILEIHEQMQIAGIAAGGSRALRLFS